MVVGKISPVRYLQATEDLMRVNTEESIKLGERIHGRFGSWEAARKAARLRDGVYVVPAADDTAEQKRQASTAA